MNEQHAHYLEASFFIDSQNPKIISLAQELTQGISDPKKQSIKLYYAVRDMIRYNPYPTSLSPLDFKASSIISRKNPEGHCIDKAIVLAALARALAIPSRLHFSNVRNHIGTAKLEAFLGTNVLVFHGFLEFYLNGKWVKCTPAFNQALCDKLNVEALDFDGENDSIFQEYDKKGGTFMEYLHDYGIFHEFPLDMFRQEMIKHYPKIFKGVGKG